MLFHGKVDVRIVAVADENARGISLLRLRLVMRQPASGSSKQCASGVPI